MRFDESLEPQRIARALTILVPKGFTQLSGWWFAKDGKTYDLSAADLDQIDRIEREGLFVKSH